MRLKTGPKRLENTNPIRVSAANAVKVAILPEAIIVATGIIKNGTSTGKNVRLRRREL